MMLGCMTTLNEVQRAVVDLRLIDEVPGEDVAQLLGAKPGHVAVLLFRAKQRLRQCVAGATGAEFLSSEPGVAQL